MIKKLRKNIILVNMLLVGTVILLIFAAVCINSYSTAKSNLEHSLFMTIDKSFDDFRHPPEVFGEKRNDNPPQQLNSYIIVSADASGKILTKNLNNAEIDESKLEFAVMTAVSENRKSGEIDELNLIYTKNDKKDRITIAFADNSSLYSPLRSTVFVCAGLFVASLVVIFLISLALSGIAVNPVKTAWRKQKQFVADASHELKTPLTVILANNNIMLAHRESKIQDEIKWLQSTEEEAQHMKKLIDQMLFLAKSDSDDKKPELYDVNLSEIVEAATLNFEPIAFEQNVIISCDTDKGICIKGDTTLLTQLCHILIDNAIKYSYRNKAVTISLKKNGMNTVLSVNNKGNTIEKEEIHHIFDRFYRAEKSRTTKGYGLGLSIAQNIVTSMNGKISVESNQNKGTTFTVVF